MRCKRSLVAALLVPIAGAALHVESTARAQSPPGAGDKVTAQALFEEGRKLAADGKYAEACPKLADSERLDPSPSTVLNLANCWEKVGRTATAWATYKSAQSEALAFKRPDYAATAERHADALAPSLARLTIVVPQPTDGMQLKRDGVAVDAAEWGTAIPIDVGVHSIECSAPGYKKWSSEASIARDGVRVIATVPVLEPLPPQPPTGETPAALPSAPAPFVPAPATGSTEVRSTGKTQRTIGLVTGGVGLVGLGVSGVLALLANSKNQSSMSGCSATVCSTQSAYSQRNDARSAGDASTVAFAVGAAALAAGLVVWLSAPRDAAGGAATASLVVAPTAGGAVVQGAW